MFIALTCTVYVGRRSESYLLNILRLFNVLPEFVAEEIHHGREEESPRAKAGNDQTTRKTLAVGEPVYKGLQLQHGQSTENICLKKMRALVLL